MFPITITIYHKVYSEDTRLDEFKRQVVKGVHYEIQNSLSIGGTSLQTDDRLEVVIPLSVELSLPFNKDDIIVLGESSQEIKRVKDLEVEAYHIQTIQHNDYAKIDYLNNWTVYAK